MAVCRLMAAIGLIVAVSLSGCSPDPEPTTTPTVSTEVAQPDVMLDGVYRLDVEAGDNMTNGAPDPQQPYSRNFAFRSGCNDTGCVSALSRAQDDNPDGEHGKLTPLDYIGDQWIRAAYATQQCPDGRTAALVQVWQLTPQADGTLTGTRTAASFGNAACTLVLVTPITLTRIGDIGTDIEIDDPATIEPRRVYAAAGLSGTYNIAATITGPDGSTESTTAQASTFCVRTTDRCLTMFGDFEGSPQSVVPMLFADGFWTSLAPWPDPACAPPPFDTGEPRPAEITTSLRLPQPTADPITTVIGSRSTYDNTCYPSTTVRQLLLTRTGD